MYGDEVVILNHEYADLSRECEELAAAGLTLKEAQCSSEAQVIEATQNAGAIICIYADLTRRVIESLDKCRIIARPGAGHDMIDIAAASDKKILVTYVPNYCTDEVADHTLGLILALQRGLIKHFDNVRAGNWNYKLAAPLFRLRGKTVGLLGFGRIGQRTASRLRAFTPNILAYDPFVEESEFAKHEVEKASLSEIYQRADIISLHCPSTELTRGIIGRESIAAMKKRPLLINTSRGDLVDTESLILALREGRLSGAGLDVLAGEPVVPKELLALGNIIISPHAAWYSKESEESVRSSVIQEIVRAFKGEPPLYPVPGSFAL